MISGGPGHSTAGRAILLLIAWALFPATTVAAERTTLVSTSSMGTPASGGDSLDPAVSARGRYIAFESDATNLIRGDTNGRRDIFIRDRRRRTTKRISKSTAGEQPIGGDSVSPSITPDGRFVVFSSAATNLVRGDTNGVADIFIRDRRKRTTKRISRTTAGAQALHGSSTEPRVSADGRFVVFSSAATNLVPGDTNGQRDIFVRDRWRRTTKRVSKSTAGSQARGGRSTQAVISADGRWIVFRSAATNLVPRDTNGHDDLFVHDRRRRTTKRISKTSAGAQAHGGPSYQPVISATGRWIAFASDAVDLIAGDSNGTTDVFIRDRRKRTTRRVSVDDDGRQLAARSAEPAISGDGRRVAFSVTDRAPATDGQRRAVHLRDRRTGRTRLISSASGGGNANGDSERSAVSRDGRFVAFESLASDLVAGARDERRRIYQRGPIDRVTTTARPRAKK